MRLAATLLAAASLLTDAASAQPAATAPAAATVQTATAPAAPRVCVVDDLARVRADRPADCPAGAPAPVVLAALRDEVVAFQVIVQAGDAPLVGVRVDVELPGAPAGVRIERFVEHYVTVAVRSRSPHGGESLGWLPAARPDDDGVLGELPDALVPVEHAPAWRPYPLQVPAGRNAAIWVDVTVGADAAPGRTDGTLVVSDRDGAVRARVPLSLRIDEAHLPYRAVSVFAAYDGDALAGRLEADAPALAAAERQVWQLLHAHGVDALGSFVTPADVARVAGALTGAWFTPAEGYLGPGQGVAPAVVALGAYGALGDPAPAKRANVAALAAAVPAAVADVFLYAVDEDCDSPRGPGWRRLLAAADAPPLPRPVLVAHSCSEPPAGQDVDLVLLVAERWDARELADAHARGRRVWIYNGRLPHSSTLVLDAPPSAAAALGWIAASHDVDRWFLWMTNFWNDDNRGGHGPTDPFVNVETFHNRDGDVALGDGLLVYPGTQRAPFAAHSVGVPGVLPSMRLKRLRRGLADAGYLALVGAVDPDTAAAIAALALPLALDELPGDARRGFADDGAGFALARELLRARVPAGARLDERQAHAALREVAARRRAPAGAGARGSRGARTWVLAGLVLAAGVAATVLAAATWRRRAG